MRRSRAKSLVAVGAALASLVLGSSAVGSAAEAAPARTSTYVSLGDSLAFGYQPDLVAAHDFNPADYSSYAEDFAAMRPHLALANFGCPGETTTSLISGGCPWIVTAGAPTHMPFGGASQLDAALAYLGSHSDTSLVTLDIGSNDLLAVVDPCLTTSNPMACMQQGLPGALASIAHNIGVILSAVHQAAPHAQLVVFNLYNPLALSLPSSDALIGQANTVIAGVARSLGARVADAFAVMNHAAGSPAERAFVCSRTWECTPYENIHPTDLGYKQMASALLHSLGG